MLRIDSIKENAVIDAATTPIFSLNKCRQLRHPASCSKLPYQHQPTNVRPALGLQHPILHLSASNSRHSQRPTSPWPLDARPRRALEEASAVDVPCPSRPLRDPTTRQGEARASTAPTRETPAAASACCLRAGIIFAARSRIHTSRGARPTLHFQAALRPPRMQMTPLPLGFSAQSPVGLSSLFPCFSISRSLFSPPARRRPPPLIP